MAVLIGAWRERISFFFFFPFFSKWKETGISCSRVIYGRRKINSFPALSKKGVDTTSGLGRRRPFPFRISSFLFPELSPGFLLLCTWRTYCAFFSHQCPHGIYRETITEPHNFRSPGVRLIHIFDRFLNHTRIPKIERRAITSTGGIAYKLGHVS